MFNYTANKNYEKRPSSLILSKPIFIKTENRKEITIGFKTDCGRVLRFNLNEFVGASYKNLYPYSMVSYNDFADRNYKRTPFLRIDLSQLSDGFIFLEKDNVIIKTKIYKTTTYGVIGVSDSGRPFGVNFKIHKALYFKNESELERYIYYNIKRYTY